MASHDLKALDKFGRTVEANLESHMRGLLTTMFSGAGARLRELMQNGPAPSYADECDNYLSRYEKFNYSNFPGAQPVSFQ